MRYPPLAAENCGFVEGKAGRPGLAEAPGAAMPARGWSRDGRARSSRAPRAPGAVHSAGELRGISRARATGRWQPCLRDLVLALVPVVTKCVWSRAGAGWPRGPPCSRRRGPGPGGPHPPPQERGRCGAEGAGLTRRRPRAPSAGTQRRPTPEAAAAWARPGSPGKMKAESRAAWKKVRQVRAAASPGSRKAGRKNAGGTMFCDKEETPQLSERDGAEGRGVQ